MTLSHSSAVSPTRPPLDPTAAQAREQLAHELAKPQYASNQPNVIQQEVQKLVNWIDSLFGNSQTATSLPGATSLVIIVVVVLVVVAVVIAFLVFGVPRINRRSAAAHALFGDEDDRDSVTLRRAAERAAAAGDFTTAIEESFRAIARDLAERVIVTTFPGTTAHSFAVQASAAFPDYQAKLAGTADIFDAVRYLGATASEVDWAAVRDLGQSLRSRRPEREDADA
jgi:hypothetical protein